MRVGGVLTQDPVFNNGDTGARGEIVNQPGPVTFTDDSGAVITLTPGNVRAANDTTGTQSTVGQLTTRVFGIRGAGGVVIVDVTSSSGITVSAVSGGVSESAEIGTIVVGNATTPGIPLTVTNGVPTISTGTTNTNIAVDVLLTSPTNTRVEAFDIRGGAGGGAQNGSTSSSVTIDHITNTTPGDIINVTASDVGMITAQHGDVGLASVFHSGESLISLTTFSTTFPFAHQSIGISGRNIGQISGPEKLLVQSLPQRRQPKDRRRGPRASSEPLQPMPMG